MSLFSSKTKSTTSGTTSPTNPKPVTDSLIDFTKLISSLGGQDPQQYVTGPSALQNSAFGIGAGIASRYGAQPASAGGMKPAVSDPRPKSSVQSGLYENLGVQRTQDLSPQQLSSQNFTPDQGLRDGWAKVRSQPKDQAYIVKTGGDYDNNGSISEEEYYNWHRSQFNDRDAYQPAALGVQPQGGGGGGGQPQGGGGGGNPYASPGVGYSPAQMGNNPNAIYGDAARIAQGVAGAGGNYGQASYAGQVGIDPVTNARATQGYKFSQPYENRYTDQVVDTTLANFDEYAGRQRAQEAAQAAGNNAFGGSRFGVQRAITEEQIARERASQESGLRFGAQDRAFGLGMQDANSANQIAAQNAAAANQRAQAQATLDMQRELANMGAANNMSMFNAGQGDTALTRRLAASGQMGDLAGAMGNNERADLAMLAQLGTDERNINQQGATADLNLMQLMAQLYGQTPYNLFNGQNSNQTQTSTTNPGVLGILGAGVMGAGSLGWDPLSKGG